MRIADATISAGDLIGDQDLFTVRPGWTRARAQAELEARGFTQAPVTDVPIQRFVTIEGLNSGGETVGEASRLIASEMFIQDTCPLGTALDRLRDQPVLFVRHRTHTIGVLAVADLEQPAVSLLVLGMITATEAALDELIERASSRRWLELLDEEDRQQVNDIYEDRRRHDADFSLVRCLDLPKRVDLSLKLELTQQLGFRSKTAFKRWKETVVTVRNHLAHGSTVLSALPDPAQALDTIAEVRRFATRSWDLVGDEASKVKAFTKANISLMTDPSAQLVGPHAVDSLPVAAPAFVITAANPGGLTNDPVSNMRRTNELQSALEEQNTPFIPVEAGEGDWRERSLLLSATDISPDTVFELAARYGQHSVFRLDDSNVEIVRVNDRQIMHSQPRRLAQRPSPG